jgi:hypothetical protein
MASYGASAGFCSVWVCNVGFNSWHWMTTFYWLNARPSIKRLFFFDSKAAEENDLISG